MHLWFKFPFALMCFSACLKGGFSVVFKPPCEIQRHTCYDLSECPPGTQREQSLCFNSNICCIRLPECSTNPCVNGTCVVKDGVNTCICNQGFSGDNCDIDVCNPNPCGSQGSCSYDSSAAGYTCSCRNFYSGANCETPPPCGMPLTGRFINGVNDVAPGNPWLVKIGVESGALPCSGVIVDLEWIAADALCIAAFCGLACEVVIGSYDGAAPDGTEQRRSIIDISVHPSTDLGIGAYDVALAKLSSPITLTDKVNLVCPPSDVYNVFREPRNCKVAGFGRKDSTVAFGLFDTAVRQVLDTILIDDGLCTFLRGSPLPGGNHCGFLPTPNAAACIGDNGGALVCQNDTTGAWTFEGIISYDEIIGSCTANQIFRVTDMNAVWSWVQSVITPP